MHHNEYHHSTHHSQRMPALFTVFKPVRHDNMQRVGPDFSRKLE